MTYDMAMTPDTTFHDWRAYAACATAPDPDVFHPVGGGKSVHKNTRRRYCAPCPVREQCLAFALQTGASGLYAGTDAKERSRMAAARRKSDRMAERRAARDREIHRLAQAGHTVRAIAEAVGAAERTVQRVLKVAA